MLAVTVEVGSTTDAPRVAEIELILPDS